MLRLLLVSNVVLLSAVGALTFVYYQRPEAYLFSGAAWTLVGVLVSLIRFTDPYRQPSRRRRPPVSASPR